jgi:hypothetical protein
VDRPREEQNHSWRFFCFRCANGCEYSFGVVATHGWDAIFLGLRLVEERDGSIVLHDGEQLDALDLRQQV